jgi:hypothetical protein
MDLHLQLWAVRYIYKILVLILSLNVKIECTPSELGKFLWTPGTTYTVVIN